MPYLVRAESVARNQYLPVVSSDNRVGEKNWASNFVATRDIPCPPTAETPLELTPFRFGGIDWQSLRSHCLTTLVLRAMPYMPSTEEMYNLLANNSASLVSIELWDFLGFLSASLTKPEPLVLPKLKELRVGYNPTGGSIIPYVDFIQAPHLHSLTLRDLGRCPDVTGRPWLHYTLPAHSTMCSKDGKLLLDHFGRRSKLREVLLAGLVCSFLDDGPGPFIRGIQATVERLEIIRCRTTFPRFSFACMQDGVSFARLKSLTVL